MGSRNFGTNKVILGSKLRASLKRSILIFPKWSSRSCSRPSVFVVFLRLINLIWHSHIWILDRLVDVIVITSSLGLLLLQELRFTAGVIYAIIIIFGSFYALIGFHNRGLIMIRLYNKLAFWIFNRRLCSFDWISLKGRQRSFGVIGLVGFLWLRNFSGFSVYRSLDRGYSGEIWRMGSSNLFFELQGRVLLLPISTNLHRAAGILLVEATFVVDSGGIVHLGVSRQFRRALAAVSCGEAIACCQATSVTDVVWVHLHVRISNKFCRFCNGPINALVEPTAQFHAID